MSEPEYITIVEGPTPEFRPVQERLYQSVLEGPMDADIAICELRTLNGPGIVERCRVAWEEGRTVLLDYPDDMRMRQHATVVSMRLTEWEDSGNVLKLWVQQPLEELETPDEFDEGDDFLA